MGTSVRTLIIVLLTIGFSVPSTGRSADTLVIKDTASGQLSQRLSTLNKRLAGKLELQSIKIQGAKVQVNFGEGTDTPVLFAVTLVHPSQASSKASQGGGVAIEPIPGPAPGEFMEALMERLKEPFERPLWSKTSTMERKALPKGGPTQAEPVTQAPTEKRVEGAPLRKILQLLQMGDDADAMKLLDTSASRSDLEPHDRAEIAVLYAKLGKTEEAQGLVADLKGAPLEDMAKVVLGGSPAPDAVVQAVGKNNACQAVMVAQAYVTLERTKEAETLLDAIRLKDPACVKGYLSLGQLYLNQKRAKDAIRLLSPVRAERPKDASLTLMLAHAYRHTGELDQSVRLVEDVVHDGKGRDDHVRLLITMYLQQQEERERIHEWRERSEASPDDPIPKMMVGILLHYRDEFEESERWLKPVEDVFSLNPRYQVYRAMNAFNLGDRNLARQILDRAANFKVIDPDVFYCRGELLRDTERGLAITDFKRYLALTKDSPINLPEKQERVETQIRLLEACQAENVEVCDGPWEHPRGGLLRFLALHIQEVYALGGVLFCALGFWLYRRRRKTQKVAQEP
jgi:tetratricopeptide (TPR) repeat protein